MPTDEFIVISKLEAAERQLDEAIRMFFERRDVVSVHTLAAAAYQIVTDLCKERGIPRELEDSELLDQLGRKKEVLAAIRKPQNFFKHADRPSEETVRLNPMLSAVLMMGTLQYLLQLEVPPTPERTVFRTWFFLLRPQDTPPAIRKTTDVVRQHVDPEDFEFFLENIGLLRREAQGAA